MEWARSAPVFYYQKEAICGAVRAVAKGVGSSARSKSWMPSRPFIARVLRPLWRVGVGAFWLPASIPGRVVRPAAQSLVLLRKRKVTKRKAPQLSAPSAFATGTCGARFVRGLAKLACGSNNASPDPPKAVLLGAHRWGPRGAGSARLRRASRRSRAGGGGWLGLVQMPNRPLVLIEPAQAAI